MLDLFFKKKRPDNNFVKVKTCLLRNIYTYLLTPWSRVLLEKLTSKLCS